jgi:cell division protein FtsB
MDKCCCPHTSKFFFFILLFFGIIVIGVGVFRGENSIVTYFELRDSQKVLEETVLNLGKETADLELEITKLRKSPDYALKVLRDKYHVTEENEKMIFLQNEG